MKRRTLLLGLSGATLGPAAWWALTPIATVRRFADTSAVDAELDRLLSMPQPPATIGWPLAQMLAHCAQSIECSIQGYPQHKPAWFKASVGSLAFGLFERRGAMRHDLEEPIPGAPPLDPSAHLSTAIARLRLSLETFEAHEQAYAPHFAYGALSKDQYRRAHLMHLANHWERVLG